MTITTSTTLQVHFNYTTTTTTTTTLQFQQLQHNYNYNYHYNYNYCATPHYIQELWVRWPLQPLQPLQKAQLQLQPPFGPSVDSLCHPWVTTTDPSYWFPIFETSATALCGTTGKRSVECTILPRVIWLSLSHLIEVRHATFEVHNIYTYIIKYIYIHKIGALIYIMSAPDQQTLVAWLVGTTPSSDVICIRLLLNW